MDEARDIAAVNVVADLFALVAEDPVLAPLEVALHQIAEEAVQLHAGMIGARQTAAAKAAGGHVEVAAVLLHHHVGRDLARAEETVQALVDREGLRDAVCVLRVGVIPAGLQLGKSQSIGRIAVHLVGAHVNERALRARLPRGLEQVERADGVGVEVVERNRGRAIVRRLGGRVHDDRRPKPSDQIENALPIPDVELMVLKARELSLEAVLVPARVALRPEK